MDLTDRTVLVTGGSSGIGRETALTAADHGAAVVVADVRERPRTGGEPTSALVEERGRPSTYVETDVTDLEAVRAAVDTAESFGGLDVFVNNAGWSRSASLGETDADNWARSIDVNLTGVYHGCLAAVEAFEGSGDGGAIVNIASIFGITGAPNSCSYSAAKGGVVALTRQVARDYASAGIRVNAVSPGFIETPMLQQDTHEGTRAYAEQTTPMDRIGEPAEVATAVVFLASDAAGFITGQNLPVDGGWLMG